MSEIYLTKEEFRLLQLEYEEALAKLKECVRRHSPESSLSPEEKVSNWDVAVEVLNTIKGIHKRGYYPKTLEDFGRLFDMIDEGKD